MTWSKKKKIHVLHLCVHGHLTKQQNSWTFLWLWRAERLGGCAGHIKRKKLWSSYRPPRKLSWTAAAVALTQSPNTPLWCSWPPGRSEHWWSWSILPLSCWWCCTGCCSRLRRRGSSWQQVWGTNQMSHTETPPAGPPALSCSHPWCWSYQPLWNKDRDTGEINQWHEMFFSIQTSFSTHWVSRWVMKTRAVPIWFLASVLHAYIGKW